MEIRTPTTVITIPDDFSLVGDLLYNKDLRSASFSELHLDGTGIESSDLEGASFSEASLYWVRFFMANLSRASFRAALIRGCDFKKANLSSADFRNARLIRDNLGGFSDFSGADLRGTSFLGADIEAAWFDDSTQVDDGVDLEKLGFSRKVNENEAGFSSED